MAAFFLRRDARSPIRPPPPMKRANAPGRGVVEVVVSEKAFLRIDEFELPARPA